MDVWIGKMRFDVLELIDTNLEILFPHDPTLREKVGRKMKDLLHLAVREAVTETGRRERRLLLARAMARHDN